MIEVSKVAKLNGADVSHLIGTEAIRQATIVKSKGSGSTGVWCHFKLEQHALGKDADGDDITSCTIEELSQTDLAAIQSAHGEEPVEVAKPKFSQAEVEVLEAVGALIEDGGDAKGPVLLPAGAGLAEVHALAFHEPFVEERLACKRPSTTVR